MLLIQYYTTKRKKKGRKKGEGYINCLWQDRQMGPAGIKYNYVSLISGSK